VLLSQFQTALDFLIHLLLVGPEQI